MSNNQKIRLQVAAKDLIKTLQDNSGADKGLLVALCSLRFEVDVAVRDLQRTVNKNTGDDSERFHTLGQYDCAPRLVSA